MCKSCQDIEIQYARNWIWQIVQHKNFLGPPRDLVHRVLDIVEHFLRHHRIALDLWLRLAAAQRTLSFFHEYSEKRSFGHAEYWLGKIAQAERYLSDVQQEITRSKTAVRSWPSAPDCYRDNSPVPLVVSAVLAEALSLWMAPPSICQFTSRFLDSFGDGEVKGLKQGDDYWSCLMVKLLEKYDSLNGSRSYYSEESLDKVRALARHLYEGEGWFSCETGLVHIRRIAAATGLDGRSRDAAMLLHDISIEDRRLQSWERDVRVAACVLVAYLRQEACGWDAALPQEKYSMAVDILRVAGNPTGERVPSARKPYGVISCAERLIECLGELLQSKDNRVKYGSDFKFTFEWCRKYREWEEDKKSSSFSWDRYACDPPHYGLIASLEQAIPSSFKLKYSIIEREAAVWDTWSSCPYRRSNNDMGIDWLFTRAHLRPIARYIAVRRIFAKTKARKHHA